jgi:hypothetical protein
MDLEPGKLIADLTVAGVLAVWLWKGLLPEIRGMRAELRAVEKHLAAAGQARMHLEGGVKELLTRVPDDGIKSLQADTSWILGHIQQATGRTTRPEEPNHGSG